MVQTEIHPRSIAPARARPSVPESSDDYLDGLSDWLKPVLVQAAWSAVRTRGSYLRAKFLRLKSRRGPKKAIVAVAWSMLTAVYYMLRDGVEYRDLGDDHFDRFDKVKYANRLVRKLEDCGYEAEIRVAA